MNTALDAQQASAPARPRVTLIAAVARHGGIGWRNQLLVHLPEDLRHFRRVTLGCPVLMGRKTWDSLPAAFRPLPGRRNLVLSRSSDKACPGAEVVTTLEEALNRLRGEHRVFVIGGAEIYRLALPLADEMILTEIEAEPQADAFFPDWPRDAFKEIQRLPGTEPSEPAYAFVTYQRRHP